MANGYDKGRIKTACGRSTTQAAAPSSKLTACLWQDWTKKRADEAVNKQGIYIARIKAPERHNAHTLCTSFEEQFPERKHRFSARNCEKQNLDHFSVMKT
jgi:hypothetical protein